MKIGDYVTCVEVPTHSLSSFFTKGVKYEITKIAQNKIDYEIIDDIGSTYWSYLGSYCFIVEENSFDLNFVNTDDGIQGQKETQSEFATQSHGCQTINGLTKRDYFAGLAMQSFISNASFAESLNMTIREVEEIVEASYAFSEKMVKQSKKQNHEIIK